MDEPRSQPAEFRRFARLLGALLLGSVPLVILGSRSFFIRDFAAFGYPLAHFHKAAFLSGSFPLWNPLNYCGVPHFAQWNTMLLYPGSLLYLLLPLPWALNLFCVAHQFLAGLGMYRLSHSLTRNLPAARIAGIGHAFGGLTLTSLMWPNNIAALGLLPWVIWATLRAGRLGGRAIPVAVAVGTCQMLCGAPEIILVTWIFAGAVVLADPDPLIPQLPVRRRIGRILLIVLLIALISSVQLLPFFELLHFSNRPGNGGGTGWSASASCWVNLFLPSYQGVQTALGYPLNHFQKWTLSFYPGMVTLLCLPLAFSRERRLPLFLGCLALGGLALSSGHYSAAYQGLAQIVPLDFMRFPIKFILLPAIALPLLAGFGWSRLEACHVPQRVVLIGIAGGFVMFSGAVFMDQSSQIARPERPEKWVEAAVRGAFLLAAAGGLLFSIRRPPLATWLLPLLLWADLQWHMPALTSTVVPAAYRVDAAPLLTPPARLFSTHDLWTHLFTGDSKRSADQLRTNLLGRTALLNLLRGESKVDGFLSLTPPLAKEMLRAAQGDDWRSVRPLMADFLGAGSLGHWRDGVEWQDRATAAALVTSGQQPIWASVDEHLERLHAPGFDPFAFVCLDNAEAGLIVAKPGRAAIRIESFAPHEIRFHAHATNASIAIIAQSWYPAWKAYVNGCSVPISRANLQFQAIPLPPGISDVTLRYEDRAFRLGIVLSAMALLATVALWFRSARTPNDDATGVGKG